MLAFADYNLIEESVDAGLATKAQKSGVPLSILKKVYKRGVAAWNSGHRPGTTPQQWGMARVNSYITKGKGTYHGADKDLREEWLAESGGEVVWKKGNAHVEKYSDDAFALYIDGKKQKFFTTVDDAKAAANLTEGDTSDLRRVPKDKESGLPKKYVAGLSAATAKARAAHWDKADKMSDRDPEAYKPAPGDATAKTKESKHTKKYRAMFGEDMDQELFEAHWEDGVQVGIKPIDEATYQGREVPLNKPMAGDVKKSKVYVDPDGDGKAKKVNFGDPNMTIKKNDPERRRSFRARHNCDNPGPKDKARYWSCKAW